MAVLRRCLDTPQIVLSSQHSVRCPPPFGLQTSCHHRWPTESASPHVSEHVRKSPPLSRLALSEACCSE